MTFRPGSVAPIQLTNGKIVFVGAGVKGTVNVATDPAAPPLEGPLHNKMALLLAGPALGQCPGPQGTMAGLRTERRAATCPAKWMNPIVDPSLHEAATSADRARSPRALRMPSANTSTSGQWSWSAVAVRLSCPA